MIVWGHSKNQASYGGDAVRYRDVQGMVALGTTRVILVALLGATLSAVALTPKASAALALEYDPPEAPPGAVVSVETAGGSGILFRDTPRLFLAPATAADKIKGPTDPRLSPIGELEFDEDGVGRLTFTVPDLPAGLYVAVVGGGPTTAPEGFRVTAMDPDGDLLPDSGGGDGGLPTGVLIVLVAVGILLAGTGAALFRRGYRDLPRR